MRNKKRIIRVFLPLLIVVVALLPVQAAFCQSVEIVPTLVADKTKVLKSSDSTEKLIVEKDTAGRTEAPRSPVESSQRKSSSSFSTGAKIAISAGVAALAVGVAVAVGGGGGGGSSSPPLTPPTADQLVSPWHAEGHQPGSGRSYTGTYHLYQGGGLGYDLHRSDGQHLVGGGGWRINEYTLTMHTDHGSRYKGNFVPGNYSTISLNAPNSGWTVTLTR